VASLEQHKRDCVEALGEPFQNVHEWLDAFFPVLGPYHRKVRHHSEGVEEIRHTLGEKAALAAQVHILRDCRNIPSSKDYETGYVDALGLKKEWPTTAYIRYSEEDFKSVIKNQLFGPTGLLLWAFVDSSNLPPFLMSITRLTGQDLQALLPRWSEAATARSQLEPLPSRTPPNLQFEPAVSGYITDFQKTPLFQGLRQQFPTAQIAYVPVNQLVNPLVYIDNDYVESIKPELQSCEPPDVAKFALPSTVLVHAKGVKDPTLHNVTFVSSSKTLTVSAAQIRQLPEGTEVRFLIANNLALTMVTAFQDRYIMRNGIHRAYLLARLGVRNIPCVVIGEEGLPSLLTSAYPAFVPGMLMQPRPPMVVDFLNDNLVTEVPLLRTNKIIRIVAEEWILPVD
jgi:hypothetical protein